MRPDRCKSTLCFMRWCSIHQPAGVGCRFAWCPHAKSSSWGKHQWRQRSKQREDTAPPDQLRNLCPNSVSNLCWCCDEHCPWPAARGYLQEAPASSCRIKELETVQPIAAFAIGHTFASKVPLRAVFWVRQSIISFCKPLGCSAVCCYANLRWLDNLEYSGGPHWLKLFLCVCSGKYSREGDRVLSCYKLL